MPKDDLIIDDLHSLPRLNMVQFPIIYKQDDTALKLVGGIKNLTNLCRDKQKTLKLYLRPDDTSIPVH